MKRTSRETLQALFGEAHAMHSVAGVEWLTNKPGVLILCSCNPQPRFVDARRAKAVGLTMDDLLTGLRHAPHKPLVELR